MVRNAKLTITCAIIIIFFLNISSKSNPQNQSTWQSLSKSLSKNHHQSIFTNVKLVNSSIHLYKTNQNVPNTLRLKDERKKLSIPIIVLDEEFKCDNVIKQPVILFNSRYPNNLWHFMNDGLMNVYSLIHYFFNDSNVILMAWDDRVVNTPFAYLYNSLAPIQVLNNIPEWCFETLIIGTHSILDFYTKSFNHSVYYEPMIEFRRWFLNSIGPIDSNEDLISPEIVIIGRRNSRRMINEESLLNAMKQIRSSALIFPEDYSLPALQKLLSKTRILIAIHGAGLTNMIFLNPPFTVIQIIPFGWKGKKHEIYRQFAFALAGEHCLVVNRHRTRAFLRVDQENGSIQYRNPLPAQAPKIKDKIFIEKEWMKQDTKVDVEEIKKLVINIV